MHKLVLLRHGESTWNQQDRFTGWTDVALSERGRAEAKRAGRLLLEEGGYVFDLAYTSVLKRAILTLWLALEELDLVWIPVVNDWRLNERHYGALQGLNKTETAALHGAEQVKIWRRSYDVQPPALKPDDPRHPSNDRRYAALPPGALPLTESLKDTIARVVPCWQNHCPVDPRREAGAHRRARQFAARARQIPRRDVRCGNRRAEYPDRCAAALRARYQSETYSAPLPWRPVAVEGRTVIGP